MPDKPDKATVAQVFDRPHAPVTFFDEAPVFNNYNGIIGITLATNTFVPDGKGGITSELVAVNFLRGNIQAFLSLRDSINNALLLGAKTEGEAN
jgi:hypothetical protein